MKRLTLLFLATVGVGVLLGWLVRQAQSEAPTHTITTQRLALPSPPPNLETPTVDGMAALLAPTGRVRLQSSPGTNAPAPAPTFADGVLCAAAIFRQNPGFITLLSPQEQLALCARVWQQRAVEARGGGR